jgi:hypothetical protein
MTAEQAEQAQHNHSEVAVAAELAQAVNLQQAAVRVVQVQHRQLLEHLSLAQAVAELQVIQQVEQVEQAAVAQVQLAHQ